MAESSVGTSYTNASIRRISQHANMRDIESDPDLREKVLKKGQGHRGRPIRFLSQQSHSTQGSWACKMRLHAWLYIRRQEPKDIVDAVRFAPLNATSSKGSGKAFGKKGTGKKGGVSTALSRMGPLEQKELEKTLVDNPIYHVVIRGNDPVFVPEFGRGKAQDLVTNYFVTGLRELCDMVQERIDDLFCAADFGETPAEAFRTLMADHGFVTCLEEYFKLGDQHEERNLKLAGRLGGGKCLLHRAIKDNEMELLAELLEGYGQEETAAKPWLRLAEPFWQHGQFRLSAFHRAVYDGRPECLRLLLQSAKKHGGIDRIRELQNLEDREYQDTHHKDGMTALEMAEAKGNAACFNVLAEFLGVPKKAGGVDAETRDTAFVHLMVPRLELSLVEASDETNIETHELPANGHVTWQGLGDELLPFLRGVLGALSGPAQERPAQERSSAACERLVGITFHQAAITDVALSEAQFGAFVSAVAGVVDEVNEQMPSGQRKFQLNRFVFRACRLRAGVPQTTYTALRAVVCAHKNAAAERLDKLAARVRFDFGFLPWSRGVGLPGVTPAKGEDKVEASKTSPGDSAGSAVACSDVDCGAGQASTSELEQQLEQLGHDYYARTVFDGEAARDIDFWFACKLITDRVLSTKLKWLFVVVQNARYPEKFLVKVCRKLALMPGAADGDASTGLLDADQRFRLGLEATNYAQTVFKVFWDPARLIFEKPANPADNLQPEVVFYVEFLLRAWFAGFEEFAMDVASANSGGGSGSSESGASSAASLWSSFWLARFVRHLGGAGTCSLAGGGGGGSDGKGFFAVAAELLREGVDKCTSSLLRMDGALEYAYQKIRTGGKAFLEMGGAGDVNPSILRHSTVADHPHFVAWMRALIPLRMLKGCLPLTSKAFAKLELYYEQ